MIYLKYCCRLLLFQKVSILLYDVGSYSVGGVCSSLESKPREARVKILGWVVGKLVLPSSWVVLVASSVLPNLVAYLMANMVTNLMANMVTHLMTSMVASVMTLRIGWISSEDMARLDRGHMGTIGVTLAVGSTMTMPIGKSLAVALVDSLPGELVVDWSRVDGGGRLHRHVLGGQRCRGGCEKSWENK